MLINITDDIVRLQKAGILDRLLYDKTTGRNILWATDAYTELGARYERNEEIAPELITGTNLGVIKTWARKAFEQQTERTRHRAEVFTPLWIVQKMCDALDEAWFGYPDVFFKDGAPTEHVRFFENSHTWLDYVDSRRMEITCGEGPFLVSRYDAANGELIPVAERVGLLDRKLRVVSENAENEVEWLTWAFRAFQSVYGYEWAGDNLLIARVNLLASFGEYFQARWGHAPQLRDEKKLANIIAWNIWQMDGLSYTVPYSHAPEDQISFFKSEYRPPPLCHTFNWRARKNVELKGVGTEMKFDFIIGNPPYQEDVQNKGDRANPIYDKFIDESYKIGSTVELIHPARFLFNAGQTPKAWNQKMLSDEHLKVLYYEADASRIFPNTEIKGGVAITLHSTKESYGAIDTFTQYNELNAIIHRVAKIEGAAPRLNSIIASQGLYRFSDLFFDEHPEASAHIGAGTGRKIVSSIMEKLPDVFVDQPSGNKNYVRFLGRVGSKRIYKCIERRFLEENGFVDYYNLFIPEANNSGKYGETLTEPVVSHPGEGASDTFLSAGQFESENEPINLTKYMKTKFFRSLLGVKKVTQHCPPAVWKMVPLQDFTPASDIDWSKSIPEIDQQLYRKYGLDQTEIDFIESHVKEMT